MYVLSSAVGEDFFDINLIRMSNGKPFKDFSHYDAIVVREKGKDKILGYKLYKRYICDIIGKDRVDVIETETRKGVNEEVMNILNLW